MSELLVLTGPVGVGKTTVSWEITEVLEERGIPYGLFDPDAVHFRPVPDDDPFGYRVSLAALDAAWPLMGAERLIVPMVVESRSILEHFRHWSITVARLTARADVLEARIRQREIGAGLAWHLARAVQLQAHWQAHPVEDLLVETDGRAVREIAVEILDRTGWI